jgi:hypothetical protein
MILVDRGNSHLARTNAEVGDRRGRFAIRDAGSLSFSLERHDRHSPRSRHAFGVCAPAAAVKAAAGARKGLALTGADQGRAIIKLERRSMRYRYWQRGNDRDPQGRDPRALVAGLGRAAGGRANERDPASGRGPHRTSG